ncbi:hypothetical protein D3C75_1079400 [compost metagenome]
MGIQAAPGHILTASAVAAFNDQHIQPGLRHHVAGYGTCDASTDHDGIKFIIRHAYAPYPAAGMRRDACGVSKG